MMSLSHNCVDGKYTLLRSTCSANVFAFGVLSLSWELLAQQHLSFCVMITHLVSVVRFLVIDSYRPSIFCSFHHCKNGHQMPDETSTVFAFVLAYVARIPFNVDIVDVGKMCFQMATMFAFVLAYVATKPVNVDIVFLGEMLV